MIKTKKNKVGIAVIVFLSLLVIAWSYKEFFSPEAVIKGYLVNQFNYDDTSIGKMQLRREKYLSPELLSESQRSGEAEERKQYAITNGEHCTLQGMEIQRAEDGKYMFEIWYWLRYDAFETDNKRMHVSGIMELTRADIFFRKISSMEVMHACEEIIEKE